MEPKIRLKGFSGEWKETSLANIGKCFSGIGFPESEQGGKKGIPFYKVSDMNNDGNDKFMSNSNNYVTEEQVKKNGWKVCTDVPAIYFAKVGAAVLLNRKRLVLKPCLCDNNTMLYSFDKKVWETYFCQSYFETIDLASLVQVGSLPSYNGSMVGEIKVSLPDLDEQKALGAYFQHLDSLIQSNTKKIESLKQVKAASLQSMFPQEGETTPRVRFKGFEGEWEEVSLGEETYPAGIKNHDNLPLESYSISNEFGFIPQNVQFENGGTMATADKRMYYIVSKNSFGYNPARINVGSLGYYTGEDDVIVSSLYEIFKTSDRICDTFLLYWFKTSKFQKLIEQYQEGGVRFYFFYDKLCMCHTLVPSYEEQQKIASYFTNLDSQISLQTQRLEKLKQIKSACLDNMFV